MRKTLLLLAVLAGVFVIAAHTPAQAQLSHSWGRQQWK
jgi:hypothetical protein